MNNVTANKKTPSQEHGFILIEFVISVAFMAILGGLVVNMMGQGWDLNSRNSAVLEVAVGTSTSTTWLVRDIHMATATDISDGGGTQTAAQFTWVDSGGAHACDYDVASGVMRRTCDSVTYHAADNISNLTFERVGDLVTISYTVTAPNRNDISDAIVLNVALGAG